MNIFAARLTSGDNFLQLLGVLILFIVVLVITYLTTKFVGGVKMGALRESNFKVIDTYKLTQNKYLQIVKVGTRYFVIAVGKDDIRLLTELKEDEITVKDRNTRQNNNFQDILKTFKKQIEKEDKSGDLFVNQSEESDLTEKEDHH
ncbi:flagellar protein FliO/FliZ [Anaerocolumna jejuensis DSM 15929]|jgi:flagellar protein FliO/FliZ|uniref:Flagellar protein FliO/FliZ n=1 Tax=Anaerocolumna jejuensis DSM 15929 TaxID=1121322 RepID=A0A1M6NEN8_9FIRM|nr:flagellar biosynthetic protein FliO [Anaerocolumna jejuensis]SHJ94185.1 flagellar protein FliO/FliZ [Anaerocolumna jejuensis DSM 15929]